MNIFERIAHATGLTPVELVALVSVLLGLAVGLVIMMALCHS